MHGWPYAVVHNLLRKSNVGELSVLSPLRPPATAGKLRTRRKDWARNGDGGVETRQRRAGRGTGQRRSGKRTAAARLAPRGAGALRILSRKAVKGLGVKRSANQGWLRPSTLWTNGTGLTILGHDCCRGTTARLAAGRKKPQVVFASCGRSPEGGACEFSLVVERESRARIGYTERLLYKALFAGQARNPF